MLCCVVHRVLPAAASHADFDSGYCEPPTTTLWAPFTCYVHHNTSAPLSEASATSNAFPTTTLAVSGALAVFEGRNSQFGVSGEPVLEVTTRVGSDPSHTYIAPFPAGNATVFNACAGVDCTTNGAQQCRSSPSCSNGVCGGGTPRPDGTFCSDGNPNSHFDRCEGGECVGVAQACSSDHSPCTVDACHGEGQCVDGACLAAAPFPDGAACTLDGAPGTCQLGVCRVEATCEEGATCTAQSACVTSAVCSGGRCVVNPVADGTDCSADGVTKACSSGQCLPLEQPTIVGSASVTVPVGTLTVEVPGSAFYPGATVTLTSSSGTPLPVAAVEVESPDLLRVTLNGAVPSSIALQQVHATVTSLGGSSTPSGGVAIGTVRVVGGPTVLNTTDTSAPVTARSLLVLGSNFFPGATVTLATRYGPLPPPVAVNIMSRTTLVVAVGGGLNSYLVNQPVFATVTSHGQISDTVPVVTLRGGPVLDTGGVPLAMSRAGSKSLTLTGVNLFPPIELELFTGPTFGTPVLRTSDVTSTIDGGSITALLTGDGTSGAKDSTASVPFWTTLHARVSSMGVRAGGPAVAVAMVGTAPRVTSTPDARYPAGLPASVTTSTFVVTGTHFNVTAPLAVAVVPSYGTAPTTTSVSVVDATTLTVVTSALQADTAGASLSAVITAPGLVPTPPVVIGAASGVTELVARDSLGPCDALTIDASAAITFGPNTQYTWAVTPTTSELTALVAAANAKTGSASAGVVFPSTSLDAGVTYTVSVTAQSSDTAVPPATISDDVTKSSTVLAGVTIVGAATRTISAGSPLTLTAMSDLTSCSSATSTSQVTYFWQVVSQTTSAAGHTPPTLDLSDAATAAAIATSNPATITVPATLLSTLVTYTFKVTAVLSSTGTTATATVEVAVGAGKVVAVVSGSPHRAVSSSDTLTLDASGSFDEAPATGLSLAYSWECYPGVASDVGFVTPKGASHNVDCNTRSGAGIDLFVSPVVLANGGQQLSLPTSHLPQNAMTVFRLVVSTGSGSVPPYHARTSEPVYVAVTVLGSTAVIGGNAVAGTAGAPGTTTVAVHSVLGVALQAPAVITASDTAVNLLGGAAGATGDVVWRWVAVDGYVPVGAAVGSWDEPLLVLDATQLNVGTLYVLRLWAVDAVGAIGFADHHIQLQPAPTPAQVSVVPHATGAFGNVAVFLTGWPDPHPPLSHRVLLKPRGDGSLGRDLWQDTSVHLHTTAVPGAPILLNKFPPGDYTVQVEVSNAIGGVTTVDAGTLSVTAPAPSTVATYLDDISTILEARVQSGDSSAVLQEVVRAAGILFDACRYNDCNGTDLCFGHGECPANSQAVPNLRRCAGTAVNVDATFKWQCAGRGVCSRSLADAQCGADATDCDAVCLCNAPDTWAGADCDLAAATITKRSAARSAMARAVRSAAGLVSPKTAVAQHALVVAMIGVTAAADEHSFDSLGDAMVTLLDVLGWYVGCCDMAAAPHVRAHVQRLCL